MPRNILRVRAVRQHRIVVPGRHLEAAVFDRRIRDREPDRDEFGVVDLFEGHALVLAPVRRDDMGPPLLLWRGTLWQLDPDVLDRVRCGLRADQRFHDIENVPMRHQIEDRRSRLAWLSPRLGDFVVTDKVAVRFHAQARSRWDRNPPAIPFHLVLDTGQISE